MKDADQQVKAIAEDLAEELGDHDSAFYFRKIMQQSKLTDKPRQGNRWNTFLSMETTAMNKGESLYARVASVSHGFRHRVRGRQAQESSTILERTSRAVECYD